ncbi:MAG: four-carbon acid sugar kinase family protein [Burkholderiaceae bacterium]|nr:four-carbon acid sugar kinase family protein [Burkholderiaceae bacterium]
MRSLLRQAPSSDYPMLLGCIADDFTGATDLANMLVRGGMRTVQAIGVPAEGDPIDADAVVVSLKSRTAPPGEAIAESLAACRWLRGAGAHQIFFKYCSTFDSTDRGNIGPVIDALLDELGSQFTIACPAFPENGRSVYRGYLFVGDLLLSESGMEKHPLTPMTDPNLVRVLQRQTRRKVGLARYLSVASGAAGLRARFDEMQVAGAQIAIVDALSNADLEAIGEACADLVLVTGGSGVAIGLPRNFVARGRLDPSADAAALPRIDGAAIVVSGSCSQATNAQVARWRRSRPAFRIDPIALHAGHPVVAQAIAWSRARVATEAVLVYATSAPDEVEAVQRAIGAEAAGALVEDALASIVRALVAEGARKLVAAGGETSGAVVKALGVTRLRVGPQIDPGVPWMVTEGAGAPIAIALKSGNFGTEDFFAKALAMLENGR